MEKYLKLNYGIQQDKKGTNLLHQHILKGQKVQWSYMM